MNTAEYIVKRLEELGINDFFGLPSDYNFNILYEIDKNPNTNWIGCTNELNSGFAADGYARIRGYGAVVTTYGSGELSLINAIAGSMAENIPVVCLVGVPNTKDIDERTLVHHNLQNADYYAFSKAFESVTVASAYLTRDNAKIEIDRVLKALVKEKKPIYIAIPDDIALTEIKNRSTSYEWISDKDALNSAAAKIAEKINNAQKPVIIGDCLIKRFDALIEYKEFVAKSGIPVSNFMMGTNLINMEHEKYIGGYFGKFRNPIAQKYIEESDCLIAIGTIYSDLNSFGCKLPFKINEQIAIYGTYTYVEGKRYDNIKMSELLEKITELIEPKAIEINRPNIGYKPKSSDGEILTADYIYPRIQEFIKENDIVVCDNGSIPFGIAQVKFPQNVELQLQTLWDSIGWATPAALGCAVAKPQSRVILITGDSSHIFSAAEIGTMLRRELKPVVIVINNNGYSMERLLSRDPNEKINDIMQVNYAKFARVFEGDVWATKTTTCEDFDKALKVTQIMNKMCYIEAVTEQLDVPPLAQEFACSMKKYAEENTQHTQADNYDNIDNLILSSTGSGFEFETIVHKGFQEEESNNSEETANG